MAENNILTRVKNAWNAFMNKDPTPYANAGFSSGFYTKPDRIFLSRGIDRTIITSIYNRMSLDVAALDIRHVKLDDKNGRFESYMDTGLDNCLSLEANIDQTSRKFIQDIVLTMFDEGCAVVVPVDTTDSPLNTGSYDVLTMRVGRVVQWYPTKVEVSLYNDRTGHRENIVLPKTMVAIIENPFYTVMNEPNSTMQRLIKKLRLLDIVDEQSSAGKLDLIIQLPYVIKSQARRNQAEERRKDIERQLAGSKYGIAYTDGTERITQLNRSVENNLLKQVEYLTNLLFSQLGITQAIMDGTADENAMTNYYSRTIEPIASAITDEMKRKFLTKNARSKAQSIEFYRDPFKLVPVANIAEIADKFTRNEIMTSNEIRQVIGMKPSSDPKADQLINANLNHNPEELGQEEVVEEQSESNEEA